MLNSLINLYLIIDIASCKMFGILPKAVLRIKLLIEKEKINLLFIITLITF